MKIIVKTKLSGILLEDDVKISNITKCKELTDHLVRRVKELDKQQQNSQLSKILWDSRLRYEINN